MAQASADRGRAPFRLVVRFNHFAAAVRAFMEMDHSTVDEDLDENVDPPPPPMTPIRRARQHGDTPVPTPIRRVALNLTPARASPAPTSTPARASPAPSLPSTPGKGKAKAKDPGTHYSCR